MRQIDFPLACAACLLSLTRQTLGDDVKRVLMVTDAPEPKLDLSALKKIAVEYELSKAAWRNYEYIDLKPQYNKPWYERFSKRQTKKQFRKRK